MNRPPPHFLEWRLWRSSCVITANGHELDVLARHGQPALRHPMYLHICNDAVRVRGFNIIGAKPIVVERRQR